MEVPAYLGWARQGTTWWPVYVCNIKQFRQDDLHYLFRQHQKAFKLAQKDNAHLVYYLGTYELTKTDVVEWESKDEICHNDAGPVLAEFTTAMAEAKTFLEHGTVPFLAPSDLSKRIHPPPWPVDIAPGTIVWLNTAAWAPAYVFDPTHLRPTSDNASNHIKELLRVTQTNPQKYYLLYKFIDCTLIAYKRGNARILPWGGVDHSKLLLGIPRREDTVKTVKLATQRLNEFLAGKQNQTKLKMNSDYTVEVAWIRSAKPNRASDADDSSEEEGEATDSPCEDVSPQLEPPVTPATPPPPAPLVKSGDKFTQDASKPKKAKKAKKRKSVEDVAGMKIYSKKTHAAAQDQSVPQPSCDLVPVAVPKPAYFQNGIAWARVNDQRWWPVFIYNQDQWNPEPSAPRLSYDIYSFGYHKMRSHEFGSTELRPWKCSDAPALHQSSHATICQDRVFEKEKYENAVAEADDFYAEYATIEAYATLDKEITRVAKFHLIKKN